MIAAYGRLPDCPGNAAVSVDGAARVAWCQHCRWRGPNRPSYARARTDAAEHNEVITSPRETT